MWFSKGRGSDAIGAPSQITADDCRPFAPLTWVQAPSLAEANVMAPLAGTSFYQPAVRRIVQHLQATKPVTVMFTIQLAVLPSGPYSGSVAIYAVGQRVASIPSSWSGDYRAVVDELAAEGKPATCRAVLAGHAPGRDTIGIWALLWSKRAARFAGAPVLPQLRGIRVDVPDHMLTTLEGGIKSRAKSFTDRRIGRLDVVTGQISIDGRSIGSLADPAPETIAAVRAAVTAGLEPTCGIRLVREPGKPLRVVADLPN